MDTGRTGHVIVCGLHGEGLRAIEQLHLAGVEVLVVDDEPDPRLVRTVQSWGIPHLELDSRSPQTLLAAGLAGARALICVESDDLHTLETSLLARELRPELRVVVQIRNPAVGRAVAQTGVAVLDVAGLSAPSLVEACLRTGSHEFNLDGVGFVAVTVVVPPNDGPLPASDRTLRAQYGDLAPLAVRNVAGEVLICPGRDLAVGTGDEVTVLGTLPQLRAAGVLVAEKIPSSLSGDRFGGVHRGHGLDESVESPMRQGSLGRRRGVMRSLLDAADRRIRIVLAALCGLVICSTTILRFTYREPDGEGMSVLDAVYFTIATLVTVGYGDFYFRDQSAGLRLYAIVLMTLGAVLVTVFFALLTNALVSRQIERSLGRLRMTRMAGHVIVVGLGAIGIRVVELLVRRGTQVVVIEVDQDNQYLAQARALGVPVVAGDATTTEVLTSVQLRTARAIAVLTTNDLVNIETGLAVRDLLGHSGPVVDEVAVMSARTPGETSLVLRLLDDRLARSLQVGFGFGSVRSTAALAAPWFVGAALGLDVLGTFYVGDTPMLVASLRITADGGLAGLAMQELSARTRVVALSRPGGGLEYPPRRETRFQAGDVAYLIGTHEELLRVLGSDAAAQNP